MKKFVLFVIAVFLVASGFFWIKNSIKSEKEKAIEAAERTLGMKEYTLATKVNFDVNGFSLSKEKKGILNSLDYGIRITKNKKEQEIYLVAEGNVEIEDIIEKYPVNTNIGLKINRKHEDIKIDLTKAISFWEDYRTNGYKKVTDQYYKKRGTTRKEVKTELDRIDKELKTLIGKEYFEKDTPYILTITFDELEKEYGYKKEDIQSFIQLFEEGDVASLERVLKEQIYGIMSSLDKDEYKKERIDLTKTTMKEVVRGILEKENVQKYLVKINELLDEENLTDKNYDKKTEAFLENTNNLTLSMDYGYDEKEKYIANFQASTVYQNNKSDKIMITTQTSILNESSFVMKEIEKTIKVSEVDKKTKTLRDSIEIYPQKDDGLSDFATIEHEKEEGEIEVENNLLDEEDEFGNTESGADYFSNPLLFIDEEAKANYKWNSEDEFVAGDGNTYVNYEHQYIDEDTGHEQIIKKQTLKDPKTGKERVLLYEKTTKYAEGESYNQYYYLLQDEKGEFHRYKELSYNEETWEEVWEETEGTYDSKGLYRERNRTKSEPIEEAMDNEELNEGETGVEDLNTDEEMENEEIVEEELE